MSWGWTGIALVLLYFMPTIAAALKKHPSGGGIFVLNLFLGWTFIGWVVALAWSFTNPLKAEDLQEHTRPQQQRPTAKPAFPVAALAGPGTYRVEGVDKETRFDVVEYVKAESEASARTKAELRGMVVTNVRWAEDEIRRDHEAREKRCGTARLRWESEPQPKAHATESNLCELSDREIEAAIREARRHKRR